MEEAIGRIVALEAVARFIARPFSIFPFADRTA
jgi:hypothetical protein